jgi:hypothetical protein
MLPTLMPIMETLTPISRESLSTYPVICANCKPSVSYIVVVDGVVGMATMVSTYSLPLLITLISLIFYESHAEGMGGGITTWAGD